MRFANCRTERLSKNLTTKLYGELVMKPINLFLIAVFSVTTIPTLTAHGQSTQKQPQTQQATVPAPIQSVVFIGPNNSRISFVGVHVGDDPKPRLGGFKEFQGYVVVDPQSNSVASLTFDVDVESLWTQFQKLTGHLKNVDFFDTANYPMARFVSTEIKALKEGQCQITGDLTLHGKTKSIVFPANYRIGNGGLLLVTKFNLDRSQFGMDQMLSGVDKMVEVEFYLGQKTQPLPEQAGNGS